MGLLQVHRFLMRYIFMIEYEVKCLILMYWTSAPISWRRQSWK